MHLGDLKHPNELHGLSPAQLEDVARQIRERHLQVVSTSGGHLGPGLGVVELTLALYQTLDLDHDRVIWDVGHQAYPHKLITGRFNDFDSLRQQHGVAVTSSALRAISTTSERVMPAPPSQRPWAWPWRGTTGESRSNALPSSVMEP